MKFVVERKTWFRGRGSYRSKLLRADGRRCCLGFLGRACGIEDDELRGHGTPHDVDPAQHEKWPSGILDTSLSIHTSVCQGVMEINDKEEAAFSNPSSREDQLRELFAEIGIEVEFVDGEGAEP